MRRLSMRRLRLATLRRLSLRRLRLLLVLGTLPRLLKGMRVQSRCAKKSPGQP
jgi:hypothetical protein